MLRLLELDQVLPSDATAEIPEAVMRQIGGLACPFDAGCDQLSWRETDLLLQSSDVGGLKQRSELVTRSALRCQGARLADSQSMRDAT